MDKKMPDERNTAGRHYRDDRRKSTATDEAPTGARRDGQQYRTQMSVLCVTGHMGRSVQRPIHIARPDATKRASFVESRGVN